MMRNEFIERVRKINGGLYPEFTNEDWSTIQMVYTYHPSINEVTGKDQIAYLYFHFGMRIIKDMLTTAVQCKDLEEQIFAKRSELDKLQKELDKLK